MSAVIDILGREYGYTPEIAMEMPLLGALKLIRRISKRYQRSGKKVPNVSNAFIEEMFDHG